jgi:hypothetical protein
MKNLLITALFVMTVISVDAKDSDTTLYRRPYYIGLYSGYNGMFNGVFDQSSSPAISYANGHRFGIYWNTNYGLLVAFPFARRWEAEVALEGSFSKGWMMEITAVHPSPDPRNIPATYDYALHYTRSSSVNSRLQFAYEAFRKNNYAILGGVEAWCAIAGKGNASNYNPLGFALVAKSYIPVSHGNAAIQSTVLLGAAHSGLYLGLRVGFFLKGTRIYKHRPQHYYVRTYED